MQHIPTRLDHENEFIAGALALDFANTLGGSRAAHTHDHVTRYGDIVEFLRAAGELTRAQSTRLLEAAKDDQHAAVVVLSRAVRLRDAIWSVFPFTRGSPPAKDVAVISEEAALASAHMALARAGETYVWTWSDEPQLDRVIWPIARSASDLLTSTELRARVRECESDTCSWLFVDKTRNHSRRWCDMGDCGNRAKARRFRARRAKTAS